MWFLVGFGQTQGVKRWLQPGKTYTIGRVQCDIEFKEDKTLSRKHAEIIIAEATREIAVNLKVRMAVTLRDTGSLCGTTVNTERLSKEPKVLQEGDKIVFAQNTYLTLIWEPIVICCSGMPGPHKTALFDRILRFGMKYSQDWIPDICTHLIMFRLRIAPKVIQALIECRDIVSDQWIADFEYLVPELEKEWAPPDTRSTLPPIAVEGLNPLEVSFFPDERRRSMFEGKTFVLFSREQYSIIAPMIKHAKGKIVMCVPGEEVENSSRAIASFVKGHADPLMVRPLELDDGLKEDSSGKWAELIAATHRHVIRTDDRSQRENHFCQSVYCLNTRLIREQEIAFAILYISTSAFCNPSVPCPPEPFVITLTPRKSYTTGQMMRPNFPGGVAPGLRDNPSVSAIAAPNAVTASHGVFALPTAGSGGPGRSGGVGFKPKKWGIDKFWDDAMADCEVLPPPPDKISNTTEQVNPSEPSKAKRKSVWDDWDEDELNIDGNRRRPPLASVARRAELNHKAEITAIAAKRLAESEAEDNQPIIANRSTSWKKRRTGSRAASPEPVPMFSSQGTGSAKRVEQDRKEIWFESAKEKKPAIEYIESAVSRNANELGSAGEDDVNMQRNLMNVEITNLVVRRESPGQQCGKGIKTEENADRGWNNGRVRKNFKSFQKTQHAGMGGQEMSIIKMMPHEGGNLGAGADENWLDSKNEPLVTKAKIKPESFDDSFEIEEPPVPTPAPTPAPKASKGKKETSRAKKRSIPVVLDDDDDDGFTEFAAQLKKAKVARASGKNA